VYLHGRIKKNLKKPGAVVLLKEPIRSERGFELEPGFYNPIFQPDGMLEPHILRSASHFLGTLYEDAVRRQTYGEAIEIVRTLNGNE
jgi:hypothetical protein